MSDLGPDDLLHWSGGDVTRGTSVPTSGLDLATNYEGYPSFVRLPKDPLTPIDTSTISLKVVPRDHQSLQVGWSVGDDDSYHWAALVRSGFGTPTTPNDGEQLVMIRRGSAPGGVLIDEPLQPGRWYYYTLFVKLEDRWKTLLTDKAQVPIDYGHRNVLWDRLPPYYRWKDETTFAGTSNSVLRRLFDAVGFDLDITRTMAEGIEQAYSVDWGPAHLVNEVGHQNLGIERFTGLGEIRTRALTGRAARLYRSRGTLSGVRVLVETLSQTVAKARSGRNLLLVPDDSEFVTSTGHWASVPAPVGRYFGSNATDLKNHSASASGTVSSPSLWSAAELSVAEDVSPPIIGGRSIGANAMKVSPVVRVTDTFSSVWKYQEKVSDLFICCGAGRRDEVQANGEYRNIEMNPALYGIPVEEGTVYHLSFFARKSNFRKTYGFDPTYPLATTLNKAVDASAAPVEWWSQPSYPYTALLDDHQNWVRPVSGARTTDVVYGVAWYRREDINALPGLACNDGFGQGVSAAEPLTHVPNANVDADYSGTPYPYGIQGYRAVIPAIDYYTDDSSISVPDQWQYFSHSFTCASGYDLAVPIIGLMPYATSLNQTDHYLAGISFTQEQDSGVETQFDPDQYILLGPDNTSSVLSGGGLLGPDQVI